LNSKTRESLERIFNGESYRQLQDMPAYKKKRTTEECVRDLENG
jgi:hypothetical protein